MKKLWLQVSLELKYRKYPIICWVLLWTLPQLACSITFEKEALNRRLILPQLLPFVGLLFIILWLPIILNTYPPVRSSTAASSPSLLRGEKDAAKSLFILLFIAGPVLLLQIFFMVLNGASQADIFSAMPGIVLVALFFVAYWMFAVLLPGSSYYWVSLIYFIFPGISRQAILFHVIHSKAILFGSKPLMPTSMETVQGYHTSWWLTLLFCGGIILHQYLTRKTRRSVFLAAVAFLMIVTVRIAWPVGFLKDVKAVESISLKDIRIRDFYVHSRSIWQQRMEHKHYGYGEKKIHSFSFRDVYRGVPDNFLLRFESVGDVEIQFPDDIFTAPSIAVQGGSYEPCKFRALQTFFSPSEIVRERFYFRATRLEYNIIGIPDDIVRRFTTVGGVVTGNMKLRLSQYGAAAVIPLEIGRRVQKGAEFIEITDIKRKDRGCIVKVKIQAKDIHFFIKRHNIPVSKRDYFIWEDMVIVLHNKMRQEVLTLDMRGFTELVFDIKESKKYGSPLFTITLPLNFTGDYRFGNFDYYFPKIDGSWLKHAELIVLEEEDVGEAVLPMQLENLVFLGEEELPAERHGEPLQNIILSENADTAQVREYIVRLLTYAEAQKGNHQFDKIVDKLTKVGPDYISLLARLGDLYFNKYYVKSAIEKIAGPGNKDQIIDILDQYPTLISVVCREGWQTEARPVLVKRLEQNTMVYWLNQWVETGISLKDKSLYPLLKRRLLDSNLSLGLYSLIKDLPGIDLSDVMPRFWKQLKYSCRKTRDVDSIAYDLHIGLEWGQTDAFDVAVYFLDDPDIEDFSKTAILRTLKEHLQYNGLEKDICLWLKENRENLVFSPETRMFDLPGPSTHHF